MIRKTFVSLAAAAVMATPAFAADIIETAATNGSLSMLIESLDATALTESLKGEGPFTVFAPNDNEAFAAVEEGGEIEELKMDVPKFTGILNYHVVPGKVMSSDFTEGMTLTTVEGDDVTITLADGPKVNGANIVTPDIEADNGVIHVIDAILMPPE